MSNEITIEIEPVPQPRHRVTSIGGRARTYLPTKHPVHAYKRAIAGLLHCWPTHAKGVPVRLSLVFRFAMPASWSKKKREQMRGELHAQKPDIDNLLKAVMDAMEQRWNDDCQIATFGQLDKLWDDTSSVFIRLEALTNG